MSKRKSITISGEQMTVETWTSTTLDATVFKVPETTVHGVYNWEGFFEVARNTPFLGSGSVKVRGISREISPTEAKQIAALCHPSFVKA